jgi:beta-galactosidase
MLGSGANLLGYYMFHGGRNPDGGDITLQESQATGYATDVPEKSYDFQAPFGEYGQEAPSLRKLKLVHYFLADFGAQLAPMTPRAPDKVPASPADSATPRVSARTSGDHGFLFLNNHVRGLDMPAHKGFQVELALPSGVVRIPESPIDIPADTYGIWPVNMPLKDTTLRYSTAQPFKQVVADGQTYFFFFTLRGITPEFVLDANAVVLNTTGGIPPVRTPVGWRLRFSSASGEVRLAHGVHIVLLPEADAEKVWKVDDPSLLLQTAAYAFSDGTTWSLQSLAQPDVHFSVFGSKQPPSAGSAELQDLAPGKLLLFHPYEIKLPAVTLTPTITKLQDAKPRAPWKYGPPLAWRKTPVPMAPEDTEFAAAAAWKITLPALPPTANLSDAFLHITWQGDVAHLDHDGHLLDDDFWNGRPWVVGLNELLGMREFADPAATNSLDLRILALPEHYPMYLEAAPQLHFIQGVAATLGGVTVVPQYQVVLTSPTRQTDSNPQAPREIILQSYF